MHTVETDSFIYFGEVTSSDNSVTGRGLKYLIKEKILLEGWFFQGDLKGQGRMLKADKEIYTGEFERSLPNGKGKFNWPSGAWQEGTWVNQKLEGHGTYYYKGGHVYKGGWVNDMKHGPGIFKSREGQELAGTWANNLKEGDFLLTMPDGQKYKQTYSKDKQQGATMKID